MWGEGLEDRTITHEGGHMVLGADDEYQDPQAPPQRVREDDLSYMGNQHSFGAWSLFHERHFQFVTTFLDTVVPGCKSTLVPLGGGRGLDFRFLFEGGYANIGGKSGLFIGGGLDLAIATDRLRRLEFLIGLHGKMLAQLEPPERIAFLAGLRFGVDYNFGFSGGGLRLGAFGEAGYARFTDPAAISSAYGEAGVHIGYGSSVVGLGGAPFYVRGEFAGGTLFQPSRALSITGQETGQSETIKWYRAGIAAGFNW
jgi:hypothetical protein